jgi:hypothetical protein
MFYWQIPYRPPYTYVVGSGKRFSKSATVFRHEVVKGFTGFLRVIRVFFNTGPEMTNPAVVEILG